MKQLEPEGLPKRNTVPVVRLSSPAGPKKNYNKIEFKNIKIYKYFVYMGLHNLLR